MTATALNIASPTVPGAAGPTAPGAAAGNPAAGFDALIAALFPQPDLTAAATALPTGKGVVLAGEPTVVDGQTADPEATTELPVDAAVIDATTADANAALAASLAATQTAAVQVTPTAATPDAVVAVRTPTASKVGFALNTHTEARPPLLGKGGELLAEAALDGEATDVAAETVTLATPRRAVVDTDPAKPAPPAWGRDKAPGTPAAPAPANATAQADAADTPAPVAPEAPIVEAAPAAVEAAQPALATAIAKPEPAPAPAPAAKPAKAERKGAGETAAVGDPKAPQAADKPASAHPVTAAAKPASAEAEAAGAAPAEARSAPESADGQLAAEARATSAQTAAPTHTSHAVRGSPETVANLAAQIIKKLEGQSTRFDVELDPHGLGKVNVRIDIGAHGAITAAMSFDNPQAAAELRSRAAELTRALEQAGFSLTDAIAFDVAQDRGQQGQQAWQDQGETAGQAFRGQAFRAALETAGDAANSAVNGALRLRRGVTAGLDVRV